MDRDRLSAIAHRERPIAAPVDNRAADRLIGGLSLPRGSVVLDVGCGQGEWLLRVLEWHPARGVGVDASPLAIRQAREQARRRIEPDRIELHEQRFEEFARLRGSDRYDAVLCVGSTHVLGGLRSALGATARLLRPGGCALIGAGFWEREPDAAALEGLGGAQATEFTDLAGTVALTVEAGFTPLDAHVSDAREWDDYEWAWIGGLERHAREHPDDPDVPALRAAAREHREGYLGGYRGVLGFVTCLLVRSS